MKIMWKPKLGKRASFPGTSCLSLSFQNGECISNILLSEKSIDFSDILGTFPHNVTELHKVKPVVIISGNILDVYAKFRWLF